VVQSLLPLSAVGSDLTLQMIMTIVIKIDAANIELRRNALSVMRGSPVRLSSHRAAKRRTMLTARPDGPLPKSLAKGVGLFSMVGLLQVFDRGDKGLCGYIAIHLTHVKQSVQYSSMPENAQA
jgi:hypothetical protein